jgi:hypothetical protein
MNETYLILDCWFKKNLMSLNLTKTNYTDFIINNQVSTRIGNLDSNISSTMYTKFLGLIIQYDLAWNKHIDEIIKKLNITSYMIRNIKPMVSMNTLKNIYNAYFHSVMTDGIIFWENSVLVDRVFKFKREW